MQSSCACWQCTALHDHQSTRSAARSTATADVCVTRGAPAMRSGCSAGWRRGAAAAARRAMCARMSTASAPSTDASDAPRNTWSLISCTGAADTMPARHMIQNTPARRPRLPCRPAAALQWFWAHVAMHAMRRGHMMRPWDVADPCRDCTGKGASAVAHATKSAHGAAKAPTSCHTHCMQQPATACNSRSIPLPVLGQSYLRDHSPAARQTQHAHHKLTRNSEHNR